MTWRTGCVSCRVEILPGSLRSRFAGVSPFSNVEAFCSLGGNVDNMPRKKVPAAPVSMYSLHPSFAMMNTRFDNIPKRTGKTVVEWVDLVKRYGPPTETGQRAWLMNEHGLSKSDAWWVVERAAGRGEVDYDPEGMVEAMYAGPKAGLRPLHEQLIRLGKALGDDVQICPCKTIVPFYRRRVFAEIKPATRTRIDFGFALGDIKATGRLVDTGGFAKKDRITHRIPLTSAVDIDDEFMAWLRTAYDLDA
jgi:hypothetical protein